MLKPYCALNTVHDSACIFVSFSKQSWATQLRAHILELIESVNANFVLF